MKILKRTLFLWLKKVLFFCRSKFSKTFFRAIFDWKLIFVCLGVRGGETLIKFV